MQTPALGVRTRLCSGRCRAPTPDPRFRPRVGSSDHEILIRYLQPCAAASHTALVAAAGRCYRAHDLRAHDFVLASTGLQLPRHPRELEPGVLCAKAFRFRMQRDAWNGSTPAMDHMMVSISPCHCPSVLSRHVPTSDCPGILGRRTRPRAVAVNASSKACVCTSTTLV